MRITKRPAANVPTRQTSPARCAPSTYEPRPADFFERGTERCRLRLSGPVSGWRAPLARTARLGRAHTAGPPPHARFQNGSVKRAEVDSGGDRVGPYELANLVSRTSSLSASIDSVKSTVDRLESPRDFARLRHYMAVRKFFDAHDEHPGIRGRIRQLTKTIKGRDDNGRRRLSVAQSNEVHLRVYEEILGKREETLAKGLRRAGVDDVKVRVINTQELDAKLFNARGTHISIAETDDAGVKAGVRHYAKSIVDGFQSFHPKARQSSVTTAQISSEDGFVSLCEGAFDKRPANGRATVVVMGHGGQPVGLEDAYRGLHLGGDHHPENVLGPGREDRATWERAVANAKAGDCIVVNSCYGGTGGRQLRAYAELVEDVFPKGVTLIVSDGAATADLRSGGGYIAFTKA